MREPSSTRTFLVRIFDFRDLLKWRSVRLSSSAIASCTAHSSEREDQLIEATHAASAETISMEPSRDDFAHGLILF